MPVYKTKNEDFFKKWTSEMAYVLGFFYADGNITKGQRGNCYLEFTSVDKTILLKIRGAMQSNHKITSRNRSDSWQTAYRLQIGSKTMVSHLENLGITARKSLAMKFPSVPNKYFADFVRGYFDGDGHVSAGIYKRSNRHGKYKILLAGFTSGTKTFLQQLKNDLTSIGVVKGGTLYFSQRGHRLTFSINDSLSLNGFLYKNTENGLYLARKKKVFEDYINAAVV